MIEDGFVFRYPLSKINQDIENIGDVDQIISMEYVMRSEQEGSASVFLKGYQDTETEIGDDETLADSELLAEDILSFDTCYSLYNALSTEEFKITPEVNQIGENYSKVVKFLERAEELVWGVNYFLENDDAQDDNYRLLEEFITSHKKGWKDTRTSVIEGYYRLIQIEGMEGLMNELDEYPTIDRHNGAPYYVYTKMAKLVEPMYKEKRYLFKQLHKLVPYGVRENGQESKLVTCLILNIRDFNIFIANAKSILIQFIEETVNQFLATTATDNQSEVINIINDFIDNNRTTKYPSRYHWPDFGDGENDGKGCVGILLSDTKNYFSFSGFKDVNDVMLRRKIQGSGDKLGYLINQLEIVLKAKNFSAERTNEEERYYDDLKRIFYDLKNEVYVDDTIGKRYRCCEKKLLSHSVASFSPADDIVIVTTFKTCDYCQPIIKQYRAICKSIRAFYIDDVNTGRIVECVF